MSNNNFWKALSAIAIVLAAIALWVATSGHPTPAPVRSAGGVSNYDTLGVTGFKVGAGCNDANASCTGSAIDQLNVGNCVITSTANTIAASSSAQIECAATGVVNGDYPEVTVSTSSSLSLYNGLLITGQSASSTSGTITLKVFNATGATFTWTAVASSTGFQYRILSQ